MAYISCADIFVGKFFGLYGRNKVALANRFASEIPHDVEIEVNVGVSRVNNDFQKRQY